MEGTIGPRRRIFNHRRRRVRGAALNAAALGAFLLLALVFGLPVAFGQERVAVRIGNHEGYDRAVFDWPKTIDYEVQADDRNVKVVFDQASDLDIAPMLRKFGAAASNLKVGRESGKAVLSFTLPQRVQLRHFRNDNSIVLDFVRANSRAPALDPASTRQLAQEKTARTTGDSAAPASAAQIVPPPPPSGTATPTADAQAAPPAPAVAATPPVLPPPPTAPVPTPPPREPPTAAVPPPPPAAIAPPPPPAASASSAPASPPAPPMTAPPRGPAPVALTPPAPPPATQPAPPSAAAAAAPATASASATPATPAVAPPQASDRPAPSLTVGPLPMRANAGDPMVVEVAPSAVGFRLRFPSKEPTPLATFSRDGVVWIVLERRVALDVAQVQARQRELGPSDVTAIETPVSATVLRLAPPMRSSVGVLREGETWIVEIGPRPAVPLRPVEPTIRGNSDGSGGRVVADMPGVRNVLRLKDPEANDEIIVAPTLSHGVAVAVLRPFPEFRVLPSGQGLVVHPLSDRVQVKTVGEVVEITGMTPLTVPGTVQADAAAATSRQKLLDIEAWRGKPAEFDERKQALHRAVATATPQKRGPERLALAQALFANGLAVEALGQLRTLESEAPRLAATPAVRTLRGAAAVLADDIDDADRSLAQPSLAISNEAALWRGIVRLRQEDMEAASELTLRGLEFAERYPPPIGPKVALAIAQAQVAAGTNDDAARFLDLAARQPLGATDKRKLALLRGQILARQGDIPGALAAWKPLEEGGPSPTRAEATLARIETLSAAKQIDKGQAIDTLERLRYAWRGDRTELRTLLALARIHSQNGNHRAGLMVLRDAAVQFPSSREAREITAEMDLLFARLFLDGEADKLPPIQAIALFEEFRDLVPTGTRGDAMARRLADRLVQVDLMGRAAALLEHQVKHRATGVERAELGAKLATVRLLDANPEAALQALAASVDATAPDALQAERRRLETRALADLGRSVDALAKLGDDRTPDGDRLRIEILRVARDWRGVAQTLRRGIGDPPVGDEKISDDKARALLHLATALALDGDETAIQELRQQFGASMETSPFGPIFRVVAAPLSERGADVAAIAQQVATAAPFQSFLQTYRDKLGAPAEKGS